uniref:Artemin n=1 Tax=Pygocentrus nattereri TaxID=42514 RepID=A0A3B4BWT8_PYGNA
TLGMKHLLNSLLFLQMVLWVLVSLLPLVVGERPGFREGPEGAKGDRKQGHSPRDCRLERREMRVRDLGMGHDSDEIILFKFCVGSCQSSRGNYDLALRALLTNGSLPKRTARKISAQPCCRPTGYESVSFMDASTTWRTIDKVSASDCECVG